MQSNTLPPMQSGVGLRLQLMLAFGLLTLLLCSIAAIGLMSLSRIRVDSYQAVNVEGRLSQLANEVAIHTLLCRRYEKDLFLNLDDAAVRTSYLTKWQASYADLQHTIEAYRMAASADEDVRQAAQWRVEQATYGKAVLEVEQMVARGSIATPQAANAALTPFKDNIRTLTDSAVATATRSSAAAQQTALRLEQRAQSDTRLGLLLAGAALLIAVAWSILFPARLMRPISVLQSAAERFAHGDFAARAAINRRDEIGTLGQSFDTMAALIQQHTTDLTTHYALAKAAQHEAEDARAEVAAQLATVEAQRAVIRELSAPVIPVMHGVLVAPLVGALDSARADTLMDNVLQHVEYQRARHVVFDVTGVPVVDTHVAQVLIRTADAVRLLGAEALIVGVRPEVAQALVALNIELSAITTYATLQTAIEQLVASQSHVPRNKRFAA